MQYQLKHNKNREEEQKARDDRLRLETERKLKAKRKIAVICLIVFLVTASIAAYALLAPGKYDEFAKCLTEKGAVMYGEDWCRYTQGQKEMFGRSFKYVNYKVKPGLTLRPTWVIDGKTYEKVQSFQRLSALTGCEY